MDVREDGGGGGWARLLTPTVADALLLAFLLDDRLRPSSGPTDTARAQKPQIDPFEADSLSCNGCQSIQPNWHACPTIIITCCKKHVLLGAHTQGVGHSR